MKTDILILGGIDYNEGLHRFLNLTEVYESLLCDFLDDASFINAKNAYAVNDYEQMFFNLHTLKGVTANLSIKPLYKICYEVVELLRSKKYDNIAEKFSVLGTVYNEMVDLIHASRRD